MSKVTIIANGVELDLEKDLGFGLNYSIDDIRKPESRNSNYSKTITLAGSKANNKFFGSLYDVNTDFTFFNPNIKTEAKIVIDSSTVLDGFLRLKDIEKESDSNQSGNKIVYKCTISSKAVDFLTEIKEKLIADLNFNRFSHVYNYANIVSSWSHDYKNVYTYPLLKNDDSLNNYNTSDFKPAIFYKAYLNRIAQEAGYSIKGSLMDSTTEEGAAFDKEVIPFGGVIPLIPQSEYDRRKFQAGMNASDFVISDELVPSDFTKPYTDLTIFNNDSTGGNFDNGGVWNNTTNIYTIDRNGNYDINLNYNIEQSFSSKRDVTITQAASSAIFINFSNPHGYTTAGNLTGTISGTIDYNGTYTSITVVDSVTLRYNGISYISDESGTVGIDVIGDTSYKYYLNFRVSKDNSFIYFPVTKTLNGYEDLTSANDWTTTSSSIITGNYTNIFLRENEEISIGYDINEYLNFTPLNEGVDYDLKILQTGSYIKNGVNASALSDGDTISLNEFIPKNIKQTDLITDIIKRYNAYISVNPDNDKELIIQPRDTFYSTSSVLDWTDKKDYNSKDTIKLISDVQTKEFLFTYKQSDTDKNKSYTESVDGDIYGSKKIEFNNDFTKGSNKIETSFTPTPLVYNSNNPIAVISDVSSLVGKGDEPTVCIFTKDIPTIGNGVWTFTHIDAGITSVNSFTTYPYMGHFDNPFTPQIDINFGENSFLFYNELQNKTNANLYSRFWANYINQINTGKLVTSYFNLNEVDISFIRNNLNSKIWVKDSYYYISKIIDYNPIEKGLTKIDLIKVVDGVSFVRDDQETSLGLQGNIRSESRFGNIDLGSQSTIKGESNGVGAGSRNSVIIGDNNSIASGLKNAFIIGSDNKSVTQDNEGWIGGVRYLEGLPAHALNNRIVVTQDNYLTTICGVIDSEKEYFLDGIININNNSVTIPSTGISIKGYSFDLSGLISSYDSYTMFVSENPSIGSGNVLGSDYLITTSGAGSKVYELYDSTGFNAFEFSRVNYIDCTSLGDLHSYRQGLETGTGRFGGSPTLTLHGTWIGGYRITTSIVRGLSSLMTAALFAEGVGFSMQNRFLTDINVDLSVRAELLDFTPSNFPNPSTLQLQGCNVTRNGNVDADDSSLTPNVSNSDLCSSWSRNIGLPNTFEGGRLNVNSESATVISSGSTWYTLNANWVSNRLEHFDTPASGQLRHLGNSPREYRCVVNFIIESTRNNVIGIRLRKWDDSAGVFIDFPEVRRQVNNLSGSRDVAVFNFIFNTNLNQNDYVYFQVRNNNGNNNATLELDSDWFLEER
tara:strand:- start:2458 stop:6339 length:3882 start_codon:yes stop_codon:yes gene_type:complete